MPQQIATEYRYLTEWNPSHEGAIVPPIQVVTCFLQDKDKVLVLQRARKDKQHELWGIPGGKLDLNEKPLAGLVREIQEELGADLSTHEFQLLGTALSKTPSDGVYGLFLYHTVLPQNMNVKINLEEHYAYSWVTLDEFSKLDLLTAQGEAFRLVEDKLRNIITQAKIYG